MGAALNALHQPARNRHPCQSNSSRKQHNKRNLINQGERRETTFKHVNLFLSPIQSAADAGELGSNGILPDVESLRIPVQYLANLLTAGDTKPVLRALKRMLAMRHYKRAETVDGKVDTRALEEVGLTEAQAQEMYRYLAIANYEDRFVVPSSHRELAREAFPEKNGCGFTFGDGCHGSDTKFNLFNSRRIDAIDVTSKTEPHP